ncbi:hypothetical protein O181_050366 [Austropuccinia psidii MF-1]|uniref:Uncharacterized protein n=1 Tax=Austropuccinia psidii MF-1 TaxID=1389203 RepID=A0A9Q3E1P0_9BASI|nr:hypothetical protein [Austropuccinia psidii MF-1]
MSNCAIITLKGESALTHPPLHGHTHRPRACTAPSPTHAHAHANATALNPRYCAEGSTSVIRKMTIRKRWSAFMDDLVR